MVWGLNFSVVKVLTSVLDDLWVAMLRMLIATLTLALVLLLRGMTLPRLLLNRWAAVLACGFFTVYLNQLLFIKGVHLTTAGNATLVVALSPTLAAVASAIAFRDKVSLQAVSGLIIGFGGVAFVILGHSNLAIESVGLGELLILAAMSSFVCGGLFMQRLAQAIDALQVTLVVQVVGSVLLALHIAMFKGWSSFPSAQIDANVFLLLLYSGALGTALSNLGWYYSVARVSQRKAAVFFYCVPVFGLMFAALFLGEIIRWQHVVGLALVITGTRLGIMNKR